MNRRQYAAAAIGVAAAGGLVAVNLADSDPGVSTPVAAVSPSEPADEPPPVDPVTTVGPDGSPSETTAPTTGAPPALGPAGDLVGLDGWLQTDADQFSDFDGSVRVVQFWTFGCVNCRNTFDNLRALHDEFGPLGLEVIGVHAPEFDAEADPDAIARAAVDLGVTWPIALDTDKTNFRAWQPGRRFWPRTFVLDREGTIRFDRIGEGAYDELNGTVAWLIENEGS